MENVGFYTTLTRASNVSLSDSSVLSFFFPFFFLLVVVARYRGEGGTMLTGKSSVDVRRICKSERKFFFS